MYEKQILKTLKYFSFFAYYPTLDEINTFVQVKISRDELKKELKRLKYTPPQYSIRRKISKRKLQNWRYRSYIKLLSLFPQIKLVGLSGSIAMMNANEDDDIDLFIITAKNRLFTGRFITLILAQFIGLRRSREARISNFLAPVGTLPAGSGVSQVAKNFNSSLSSNNETMKQCNNLARNKVCLNLFFDESNLKVPKFKQTEFVGHEVLQMKPIIIKGNIYERFLEANGWVQAIFPNSSWIISKIKYQRSKTSPKFKSLSFKPGFDILTLIFELPARLFEKVTKSLQLILINRHKTTEIITKNQLWFHPDDFEKKIKKLGRTTASVG